MISISLVEPNPIQREGLLAVLNREVDFLVVAVAKEPATIQIILDQHRPRILLIDFSSLLNAEKQIDKQWMGFAKDTKIIATNMEDTRFYLYEMISAGICGVLYKNISQTDLVCSVRKVANGEVLFTQDQFIQARMWSESVVKKRETLTKRERQILKSIESGVGNKKIAQEYVISQKTVAFHVSNILQKLNVRSRQEAALWVNKNINQKPETYQIKN